MDDYVGPLSSPLDTLVHKTSSRRRPNVIQTPSYQATSGEDTQYSHDILLDAPPPPRRPLGNPPQSPLLHTRFRASVATQSSFNTSAERYSHTHAHMLDGSQDIPYEDDVSIYSTATSSYPLSARLSNTVPAMLEPFYDLSGQVQDPIQNGMIGLDYIHQPSRSKNPVPLPTVVVSAEEPEVVTDDHDQGRAHVLSSPITGSHSLVGRTPSTLPKHLNFSRPVRPGGASEDAKRRVLARNAFRQSAATHRNAPSPPQPSPGASPHFSGQISSFQEGLRVPETSLGTSNPSITPPSSLMPHTRPSPLHVTTDNQVVPLLDGPSRGPSSPISLYSAYSYYQFDSPSDSPTSDSLQVPGSPYTPPSRSPSSLVNLASSNTPQQPELADQLLQQGIQHHEANRLREAAIAFEGSARTPGGSGVGMLMWGLTLRHGWGCPKDETLGFSWLYRAAEAAVGDLERARAGLDISAVRGELVLAIYEVGQCFFQGWGVKKDQKMAVSYFQTAAKLGDVDAQQELAFCYANGRGCKKNRKEAARWYRAAVAQGASDVGLAWIYKEKFQ